MTGQLPLDLALPPRYGRDDYLVSPANAAAFRLVEAWPAWPDRVLLLLGPEGAGKSHLAAIWRELAGAALLTPRDLEQPGGIDWSSPRLVEDVDRLGTSEAALFHLLNLIRETGSQLLMTARTSPDHWGLRTPDLLSRLRLAPSVRIGAPDDELMRAVLVKLFADRQIPVDDALVAYLIVRLERSLGAARAAVDRLDRAGLALGRRITRPMAATIFDRTDLDPDQG